MQLPTCNFVIYLTKRVETDTKKKNYAETDFFSSRGYLDTFFRNLCANESTNCDFFYPLLFDKYFIFQDHRNTIKRHHQKNSKTKSVLIHASREITILKISSDFWKAYRNRCAQKRQKRSNHCLGNGKPHNAPKSRRVENRGKGAEANSKVAVVLVSDLCEGNNNVC